MRPTHHAMLGAGFAAIVYFWFKSTAGAVTCFLCHFFIDLDHHIDYIIGKGKIPLRYKDLTEFCGHLYEGKLYLIFHAFEWLAILWFVIYKFDLGIIWISAGIGFTTHLIADRFYNPLVPFGYFITYRMAKGFDKMKLLTKEHIDKF